MRTRLQMTLAGLSGLLLGAWVGLHEPTATAQPQKTPPPSLVGLAAPPAEGQNRKLFRAWSDGLVERNVRGNEGFWGGWFELIEN